MGIPLPGASRSERVRMTNQLKDRNDSIASTHRDFSGIVHRESHALHWYAGPVAGMTRYFRGMHVPHAQGPRTPHSTPWRPQSTLEFPPSAVRRRYEPHFFWWDFMFLTRRFFLCLCSIAFRGMASTQAVRPFPVARACSKASWLGSPAQRMRHFAGTGH